LKLKKSSDKKEPTSAKTTILDKSEKLLYMVEEAAELMSVARSKIDQLIDAGKLPVVHLGKLQRIARNDLLISAKTTIMDKSEKLLYKLKEAAVLMSVKRSKITQLINSGELPVIRLGDLQRIDRNDLLTLISQLKIKSEKRIKKSEPPKAGTRSVFSFS